ncbi:MAG TPA: hypothetical protein VJ300_05405 [Thermoplasmata archaeon]|nr:hypothetical protein [Thermoplasmata archaeon]
MLQMAVERLLQDRGWSVSSEGRVTTAHRDGDEAILGFLEPGDAMAFADRVAESSAILCAVLLGAPSEEEVEHLEAAGVTTFSREAIEDVVLDSLLRREGVEASPFLILLEGR